MKLIRIFLLSVALFFVLGNAVGASAQQSNATYFPYPNVPDSLVTLQQRTDYLMRHFWDNCDFKRAFSARQKMAQALADYLSFVPYASRDSVTASYARLFKALEKQPDDLLFFAREAENQLIGDSVQYYSEEAYLPFARAVVANKKINKTSKLHFDRQVRILGATQPGQPLPDLDFVDREGNKHKLSEITTPMAFIYFNDPECEECHMARVRLNADIKATQLIDKGRLSIIAITPSEATDQWRDAMKSYPASWIVGAAPDADDVYDIATYPSFYLIENGKIIAKNYGIDELLTVLMRINM